MQTLIDTATGNLEKKSVERTRALREVLTSLGTHSQKYSFSQLYIVNEFGH